MVRELDRGLPTGHDLPDDGAGDGCPTSRDHRRSNDLGVPWESHTSDFGHRRRSRDLLRNSQGVKITVLSGGPQHLPAGALVTGTPFLRA